MKLFILLFSSLIWLIHSLEEPYYTNKRLIYKDSFDEDYTHILLNTQEEYKEIKNLKKSENYTNSSLYIYEWSNHPKNTYVPLSEYLPKGDSEGYRDLTIYDTIYLNIFSKRTVLTKITLVIKCQKRTPDEISDMDVAYKSVKILINFEGWKEFKIPLSSLDDSYGANLTTVSGFIFYANWGETPNIKTELYIDKVIITRLKYQFNMEESEILEENYINALNKFKYSLIGTGSLFTEKNKNIIKMYESNIKTAISTHNKMNTAGLPFDYPMDSSLDIYTIYYELHKVALGYTIEGGDLYKNKKIFDDIVYCLDYMNAHYYSKRYPKIFSGSDNWWHWDIGIPKLLLDIITYIKDELSQEKIDKYLSTLNKYIYLPKKTMSNLVEIAYSCIIAGIYQRDYKRISISVEMLREVYQNVEISDGFYEDGSFIQHDIFGYTGAYGASLLGSLTTLSYILDETCFRFDDDMKEKQFNLIINSYIPTLFEGAFFDLIRGRDVTRNILGLASGTGIIKSFSLATKYIKDEKNLLYLKTYLKYIYEKNKDYYNSHLSVIALLIIEEIISDESIKSENYLNNFSKVYSRMDKAISQINGVGIGISFSSTRTGKYESINGNNAIGWYEGDGMTYIYLSPNDYASSYWPNVNPYRLPGTTVTKSPREKKSLSLNGLAKYDFVGGTFSDNNMVAVMKFASESPKINFFSSLEGNKAYFIFGDNLICIGNNISCNDSYEVETIIENRKLEGKLYFGDDEVINNSGSVSNNYVYIENYGGIYIPDIKNVKYNITNKNFLEIYFEHGYNIINETYKYYIFPKVNKSDLKSYVDNIQILSDNSKITAVKNKLNNITEIVFWEEGMFDKIKVDKPCTMILYENEFHISDPSQNNDFIYVNIGNANYKIALKKGYTYKIDTSINNNSVKNISINIIYILILLHLIF